MRRRAIPALSVCLVLSFGTASAIAQPESKPHRYVPFPLPADADARLQERLKHAEDLRPFKEALAKLLRDPTRLKVDPKLAEGLNLDDPQVRRLLKDWAAQDRKSREAAPEAFQKLQEEIRKLATTAPPEPPVAVPPPPPVPPSPPPAAKEEPVRDWLKDWMERAQDSRFGEHLRGSPAWQKTLDNLQQPVRPPAGRADDWGLEKLRSRLLAPEQWQNLNAKVLERLGNLRPGRMPRLNLSAPSLPRGAFPPVAAPSLPTFAALGTVAVWLLIVGLAALLLWQLSRWVQRPGSRRRAAAGPRPWPVDPGRVSTRTGLIRAFDHLALLALGPAARTWHHRAVADALAPPSGALADDAVRLAALYELARYTEGPEELPPQTRDRARQALLSLAAAVQP